MQASSEGEGASRPSGTQKDVYKKLTLPIDEINRIVSAHSDPGIMSATQSLSVELLEDFHAGIHQPSEEDEQHVDVKVDMVFVFPRCSYSDGTRPESNRARRFFSWRCIRKKEYFPNSFTRRFIQKRFWEGRLISLLQGLWKPDECWLTKDEWIHLLFHPRRVQQLQDDNKSQDGFPPRLRKYILSKLEGMHDFEVAVANAFDILLAVLEEQGFKPHIFLLGEELLAVAVKWDEKRMLAHAQETGYPLRIDVEKLCLDLPGEAKIHGGLYAYHQDAEGFLEKPIAGQDMLLRTKDRAKLVTSFIADYFNISNWQNLGILQDSFHPHHKTCLVHLTQGTNWDLFHSFNPGLLNIHAMFEYFGSQIAYYFCFAQFLCEFALYFIGFSALLKLVLTPAVEILVRNFAPVCLQSVDVGFILQGVTLCSIGALFVKFWIRRRNHYAAIWGHKGYSEMMTFMRECPRPKFVGKLTKFECDESKMVLKPSKPKKRLGKLCAHLVTFAYVMVILYMCYWHFDQRGRAVKDSLKRIETAIDLSLAAQIKVNRAIWQIVAPKITEWENHQFHDTYEEALEHRLSIIFYFNALFPFLYAAFILPLRGQCPPPSPGQPKHQGCWDSLSGAFTTLILAEILMIFVGVLRPVFNILLKFNLMASGKNASYRFKHLCFLEKQYLLPEYTGIALSRDYQEVVIPLCYLFMFSQVTWWIPAVCLLFIACSQRYTDCWRLLLLYRRPIPAEQLGVGKARLCLLRSVGYASGLTNWALVCFYCEPFNRWRRSHQAIFCLSGLWMIVIAHVLIEFTLANKARETTLIIERHQWQTKELDRMLRQCRGCTSASPSPQQSSRLRYSGCSPAPLSPRKTSIRLSHSKVAIEQSRKQWDHWERLAGKAESLEPGHHLWEERPFHKEDVDVHASVQLLGHEFSVSESETPQARTLLTWKGLVVQKNSAKMSALTPLSGKTFRDNGDPAPIYRQSRKDVAGDQSQSPRLAFFNKIVAVAHSNKLRWISTEMAHAATEIGHAASNAAQTAVRTASKSKLRQSAAHAATSMGHAAGSAAQTAVSRVSEVVHGVEAGTMEVVHGVEALTVDSMWTLSEERSSCSVSPQKARTGSSRNKESPANDIEEPLLRSDAAVNGNANVASDAVTLSTRVTGNNTWAKLLSRARKQLCLPFAGQTCRSPPKVSVSRRASPH